MLFNTGSLGRRTFVGWNATLFLAIVACAGGGAEAQSVPLGAAESFAVLGGSGVTNTGPTQVVGNLGVSPGTGITGVPAGAVTGGSIRVNDALAIQAHADAATAFVTLAGLTATTDLTGQDLGSRTLPPGVYHFSSSAALTGQLILDGQGQNNPLFVFQIESTLTTASGSSIIQTNGANFSNVYFQVGSSATLGTNSAFSGTIIASASTALTTNANVNGRVLALDGAVTLDSNNINAPSPNAVITSADIGTSAGVDHFRVTVRYSDDVSINLSSIGSGDIELRRAGGGTIASTLVHRVLNSDSVATAVYNFAAPGGAWDTSENGSYSVWVRPFHVSDHDGHFAATQSLDSYFLWFNNPTATLSSTYVRNGGVLMDTAVTYTDRAGNPLGISPASVDDNDVELVGPSGYLERGGLRTSWVPQFGKLLVTYRFPARNGYWDWTDNGAYTLRVRASQVADFQANMVAPMTLNTYYLYFQTPNAVVTSTTVVKDSDHMLVALAYRANRRFMSWDSLGDGDVELVGPGGYIGASELVSRAYNANTNTYVVFYRIAARGGTWNSADNGSYSLRARPAAVIDALGYPVPAVELRPYFLFFTP